MTEEKRKISERGEEKNQFGRGERKLKIYYFNKYTTLQ
jgi:hypothetical protein